jgi:hypothetical protein
MAMSISPMSAPINTGDYYTSHGPILSASVGFLTKNRVLPTELSYQDLFDIMLYDSKVMVETNVKLVEKGVSSPISVTMTVTGITQVDTVDLYFNGVKVATYDYNLEFVNGVLTVTGTTPENTSVIPWIDNDTEVKIVVNYTSGDTKEESTHVYAIAPIYVGLIPKWLFGTTLTYDIIQGLVDDTLINVENFDIPIYGTNTCKIIMTTSIGLDIPIHYEFTYDGVERRPFIMYPTTPHPDAGGAGILFAVDCISQTFSIYYYTQSINI